MNCQQGKGSGNSSSKLNGSEFTHASYLKIDVLLKKQKQNNKTGC